MYTETLNVSDATCLVWDQTCGQKGNCWLYHKDDFRLYLNITAAGMSGRQPACHKYTWMGSELYNQGHVVGYSLKVGSWVYGQLTACFYCRWGYTANFTKLPWGSIPSQFNSVHTPKHFFSNTNFNNSYHLSVHRFSKPFLLLMVFNQNSVFWVILYWQVRLIRTCAYIEILLTPPIQILSRRMNTIQLLENIIHLYILVL